MTKHKIVLSSFLGIALSVAGASVALAETKADASGPSNVSAAAKSIINAALGTEVNVRTTAESDTVAQADSVAVNANVTSETSAVVVTRSDIDADGEITAMSSGSVSSDADVQNYAEFKLYGNKEATRIETSPERVSFSFTLPAKLLGFIPISMQATQTVEADGTVDVSYPWYGFLVSVDSDDFEASLKDRVSGELSASVDAGFSAKSQARILDAMTAEMYSALDASTKAKASTK